MPDEASGINIVVFVEAQFGSGDDRRVRCLYRNGAKWIENDNWLDNDFNSHNRVAVSQLSSFLSLIGRVFNWTLVAIDLFVTIYLGDGIHLMLIVSGRRLSVDIG